MTYPTHLIFIKFCYLKSSLLGLSRCPRAGHVEACGAKGGWCRGRARGRQKRRTREDTVAWAVKEDTELLANTKLGDRANL